MNLVRQITMQTLNTQLHTNRTCSRSRQLSLRLFILISDATFPSTSPYSFRTTNRHSRILDPSLTCKVNSLLGEALSSSTRTTYSSGVCQYLDFCFAHNLATKENLLPAPTGENLVYFVASLQGNVQYQTVKLYLAAIANFYVEQSMPLRTDNMYTSYTVSSKALNALPAPNNELAAR